MNRAAKPTVVPATSWRGSTFPTKSMLHFARQGYSIGRMAASPGSLSIAALAPVSLPEQYPDLGQCVCE